MRKEKLYSDKYRADDFQSGDLLQNRGTYCRLDPENFQNIFQEIDKYEQKLNKDNIQKFLNDKNINIPIKEFLVLLTFQTYIHNKYPDRAANQAKRSDIFFGRNANQNYVSLSEAFKLKIVQCTEMSALAQLYLQHRGIKSVYYAGNAFTSQQPWIAGGGTAHAWLMITLGGKKYMFDPANQFETTNKNLVLPAIMSYGNISDKDKKEFEINIHKAQEESGFNYLETHDIYNQGRVWLYGFDGNPNNRNESGIKRNNLTHSAPHITMHRGNDGM